VPTADWVAGDDGFVVIGGFDFRFVADATGVATKTFPKKSAATTMEVAEKPAIRFGPDELMYRRVRSSRVDCHE
jgi:hypothetical protein